MRRSQQRPGLEHPLADLEVTAREPHVIAERGGLEDVDGRRHLMRVRSTITTESAPAGIGAPGHDADRLARSDLERGRGAGRELADHPQRRRRLPDAPAVSDARTA